MKVGCTVFQKGQFIGEIAGIELPIIDKNKEATLVEAKEGSDLITIHTDWDFEGTYDGTYIESGTEIEIKIGVPTGRVNIAPGVSGPMRMEFCKGRAILDFVGHILYGDINEKSKYMALAHVKGTGPLEGTLDVLRVLSGDLR